MVATNRKRFVALVAVLGLALGLTSLPGVAVAEEPGTERANSIDPTRTSIGPVESSSLGNGLRVILQPDPGTGVVSVCTSYDAGIARDELRLPGVARLVAEMMRNGGRPEGERDFRDVMIGRGGAVEHTVDHEAATFCSTVPRSELALALWFEAGRMTNFGLTATTRKSAEQRLILEQRAVDSQITEGRAPIRLGSLVFAGVDTLSPPVLPEPDQLDSIELADLRAFHARYYVAANAVLTISGDFHPDEADRLLREHLGDARRGEPAPRLRVELPHQSTGRFSMSEDPSLEDPAAWYGWALPSRDAQERYLLELAATALVSERRLGGALVGRGKPAQSLEGHLQGYGEAELFSIRALGTASASLERIEKALDAELAAVGRYGLRPEEVTEAAEALRHRHAVELMNSLGRARTLSRSVLRGEAAGEVLRRADLDAPLPEVNNVALATAVRKWLPSSRRTIVELYPKGWQDPWQAPMPKFHLVSSGENLGMIAASYGTTVDVIVKMNGIDSKKPIYPGQKLRVPRGRGGQTAKVRTHLVRRGETLSGIALKYGVTTAEIQKANGLGGKAKIMAGTELTIPPSSKTKGSKSKASDKPQGKTHRVRSGETLSGIARHYGITVRALQEANGLGSKSGIRAGQTLRIPANSGPAAGGGSKKSSAIRKHVVRRGETLSGIAQRYGVTVTSIERKNGINRKDPIRVGRTLLIP